MSDLFFSADLPGEFDRLQRQIASVFAGFPASLRATRSETFPPVNIGSTDDSAEIVAFTPGLNPAAVDVSIDKGLLTISGERKPPGPEADDETRVYARETLHGCAPARDRAAATRGSRQGQCALRERVSDGERRTFRGVEATRHRRPVSPAQMEYVKARRTS